MGWSDVQVGLVGVSGSTVTVSAYNPLSHTESARVRVGVVLVGGDHQTLTSANVTLQAGESRSLQLTATGAIASISDGPDPIETA